jgi:hypothetical protein
VPQAVEPAAPERTPGTVTARVAPAPTASRPRVPAPRPRPATPVPAASVDAVPVAEAAYPPIDGADRKPSCTLAQMRRFIKSRPYVPLHELRRRFEIGGLEDEVSRVATNQGVLFVGLPGPEADYLGELVDNGEVGCELLLDPTGPAVIGVYPMRPVARQ